MDRALREKNATMLATGTQSILDSVAGLSEEQARLRPEPGRWSVLECIEHVILAENRMFELLTKQSVAAASPDDGRREELFARGSTNRIRKFEAPEFAKPKGRFPSLAAAVEEFRRCRARTEDYLAHRGPSPRPPRPANLRDSPDPRPHLTRLSAISHRLQAVRHSPFCVKLSPTNSRSHS